MPDVPTVPSEPLGQPEPDIPIILSSVMLLCDLHTTKTPTNNEVNRLKNDLLSI